MNVHSINIDKKTRFLAVFAAILIISGTAFAVIGAQTAGASVDIDELSVDDRTFETESIDPLIQISGEYAYAADHEPTELVFIMMVDGSVVAQDFYNADQLEEQGTFEIEGAVTDGPYTLQDFQADVGETKTETVEVTLHMQLRDGDGTFLTAQTADQATITVSNPATEDPFAALGGNGQVVDQS